MGCVHRLAFYKPNVLHTSFIKVDSHHTWDTKDGDQHEAGHVSSAPGCHCKQLQFGHGPSRLRAKATLLLASWTTDTLDKLGERLASNWDQQLFFQQTGGFAIVNASGNKLFAGPVYHINLSAYTTELCAAIIAFISKIFETTTQLFFPYP